MKLKYLKSIFQSRSSLLPTYCTLVKNSSLRVYHDFETDICCEHFQSEFQDCILLFSRKFSFAYMPQLLDT